MDLTNLYIMKIQRLKMELEFENEKSEKLDCEKSAAESNLLDEEIFRLLNHFNHSKSSSILSNQLEIELDKIDELTNVINNISLLANLSKPEENLDSVNFMNENVKIWSDMDLEILQTELNGIEEFLSSFNEKFGEKNSEMLEKAAVIHEMSKQFETDIKSLNDVVKGCTQQIEELKLVLINSNEELEELKNLEKEKQGIFNDLREKVEVLGETVKNLKQLNNNV